MRTSLVSRVALFRSASSFVPDAPAELATMLSRSVGVTHPGPSLAACSRSRAVAKLNTFRGPGTMTICPSLGAPRLSPPRSSLRACIPSPEVPCAPSAPAAPGTGESCAAAAVTSPRLDGTRSKTVAPALSLRDAQAGSVASLGPASENLGASAAATAAATVSAAPGAGTVGGRCPARPAALGASSSAAGAGTARAAVFCISVAKLRVWGPGGATSARPPCCMPRDAPAGCCFSSGQLTGADWPTAPEAPPPNS